VLLEHKKDQKYNLRLNSIERLLFEVLLSPIFFWLRHIFCLGDGFLNKHLRKTTFFQVFTWNSTSEKHLIWSRPYQILFVYQFISQSVSVWTNERSEKWWEIWIEAIETEMFRSSSEVVRVIIFQKYFGFEFPTIVQ